MGGEDPKDAASEALLPGACLPSDALGSLQSSSTMTPGRTARVIHFASESAAVGRSNGVSAHGAGAPAAGGDGGDDDGFDDIDCGGDDCDDVDAAVHPGASETWHDGVDSDCGGDADYDGQDAVEHGGSDCDDGDPDIFFGASDPDGDNIDQGCDGDPALPSPASLLCWS